MEVAAACLAVAYLDYFVVRPLSGNDDEKNSDDETIEEAEGKTSTSTDAAQSSSSQPPMTPCPEVNGNDNDEDDDDNDIVKMRDDKEEDKNSYRQVLTTILPSSSKSKPSSSQSPERDMTIQPRVLFPPILSSSSNPIPIVTGSIMSNGPSSSTSTGRNRTSGRSSSSSRSIQQLQNDVMLKSDGTVTTGTETTTQSTTSFECSSSVLTRIGTSGNTSTGASSTTRRRRSSIGGPRSDGDNSGRSTTTATHQHHHQRHQHQPYNGNTNLHRLVQRVHDFKRLHRSVQRVRESYRDIISITKKMQELCHQEQVNAAICIQKYVRRYLTSRTIVTVLTQIADITNTKFLLLRQLSSLSSHHLRQAEHYPTSTTHRQLTNHVEPDALSSSPVSSSSSSSSSVYYFRVPQLRQMVGSSITIQRYYRGYRDRRTYMITIRGIIVIQSCIRRNSIQRQLQANTFPLRRLCRYVYDTDIKGYYYHNDYHHYHYAARIIQNFYQEQIDRRAESNIQQVMIRLLSEQRKELCAVKVLQRFYKQYVHQKPKRRRRRRYRQEGNKTEENKGKASSTMIVQTVLSTTVDAAIKIQTLFRKVSVQDKYLIQKGAVLVIQDFIREYCLSSSSSSSTRQKELQQRRRQPQQHIQYHQQQLHQRTPKMIMTSTCSTTTLLLQIPASAISTTTTSTGYGLEEEEKKEVDILSH